MKVGASATSFKLVKNAFEFTYNCLGITCASVGGLYNSAAASYYTNAEPCSDLAPGVYENIAGYAPGSLVTDHNAIDLDQAALETAMKGAGDTLTSSDWAAAKNIYEYGGHSKSYAEFTVNALSAAIAKKSKDCRLC
jgi:hypothetical protein